MSELENDLSDHQETFDRYIVTVEEDLAIKHQKFVDVDARQLELERRWKRLSARVYALHERAKYESDKAFSEAFVEASGNRHRMVNSTEAKHHASCDFEYGEAKSIENKIFLLRKDVEAVCETLETRKYVLKDLVALTLHESQNALI